MYELPRPVKCDKFGNSVDDYSDKDWFMKILEETYEAFETTDIKKRGEELTDIITVCTSCLQALGFDHNARAVLQRKVNDKNERRGYFKEANKNENY